MPKITKIGILSSAKLLTIYGAGVGLVLGILYSFGGAAIDTLVTLGWITANETPGLSYGTALAFLALIGMPIIFAIIGFLLGALGALFFNLVSKWLGGIDLDLKLEGE